MSTEDETVREMLEAFNAVPLFDGSGRMTTVAERLRAAYQAARRAVLEEAAQEADEVAAVAWREQLVIAEHIAKRIRALASKETPLRDFQK